MMPFKNAGLTAHPVLKWIGTAASWLVYLACLLLIQTSNETFQLLPLAALPVLATGWVFGLQWGITSALGSVILHLGIRSFSTPVSLLDRTQLIFHLLGFLILAVLGMLAGYLQDLQSETAAARRRLEDNTIKLSRFSSLLETINMLSADLIDLQDWDHRLPILIQELGRAAGADHTYLLILSDHLKSQQHRQLYHYRARHARETTSPRRQLNGPALPSDLYKWIQTAQKGGLFQGEISQLKPETRIFLGTIPKGIYAVFPIFTNHTPWGFIGFEKEEQDQKWTQIEIDAYRIIAQTLSATVHRKIIEESLVRRAKEFESLHRTSSDISSSAHLETGITSVLAQILEMVPAYDTNIYLHTQGQLIFYSSLGPNQQQSLPYTHPHEQEISASVAQSKEDLIIPNLSRHPVFREQQTEIDEALISLPLIVAGEAIGVMNVWFPEPMSFNPEELRLLRLLADQAASAILNNQFLNIERQQRMLAESLRKAAIQLTTSLELRPVLESILEQVLKLVSAQNAHIFLYDGQQLTFGAVKYEDSEFKQPIAMPRENGLTIHVAERGEQILIPDIRSHPLYKNTPLERSGSILGMPLIFHGKVLGVMLVSFSQPNAYNNHVLRLLDLLSNQASIAIHNARTYEMERDQRKLAEALRNTGRALQSSLKLDTVLDQILVHIETVIPYDSANLMLVENSHARVVRRQGYQDLHPDLLASIDKTEIRINKFSTLAEMTETKAPLIIPNTQTDPRWVDTDSSSIILSWAGAPIIDEGKVIGFLSLNKMESDFYRPEHAERLSAFAGQAAIALRHARLFEQTQENARALEALHEATETSVSTLELNELLERILEGVKKAIPLAVKGSLYLTDEATQQMTLEAKFGFQQPPPTTIPLDDQEHLISQSYHQQRSLINHLPSPGQSATARLAAPLPAQDRILGVIYLEANQSGQFGQDDLDILTSIAATTANAVRNAQLHSEIQAKAITDSLTDVYNRRGLSQWGQYEFDRAKRFDRPLSVIFFDLDHFKQVNDTHGHEIGDLVLKQLVSRCQQVIRTVDIFARFGGEEFVVILPETDLELAIQVAERMRDCVSSTPFQIHSFSIEMSISLGVVNLTPGVESLPFLINTADQYMYQAKKSGRNTLAYPKS